MSSGWLFDEEINEYTVTKRRMSTNTFTKLPHELCGGGVFPVNISSCFESGDDTFFFEVFFSTPFLGDLFFESWVMRVIILEPTQKYMFTAVIVIRLRS